MYVGSVRVFYAYSMNELTEVSSLKDQIYICIQCIYD